MNYRFYLPEDYKQIERLCDKYKIKVPKKSTVYVAVNDDNNKICGFIGIKGDVFIEPLISENSLVTINLFNKAIRHLKNRDIRNIRCVCSKEKVKLFEKIGFKEIEQNKIIMEKEL